MKINELKENEPLKVEEASFHIEFSAFINPKPIFGVEEDKEEIEIDEYDRIKTKVFTDGEIEKISEVQIENIDEYYIGRKRYQYGVDTKKTKDIYLKNYSYVITYLIASEPMQIGTLHGWFDIIKDVKIYLKDTKDKKALKEAKKVIKAIQNHNNSVNYDSLLEMMFSSREPIKYDCEEIDENVYSLRKTK